MNPSTRTTAPLQENPVKHSSPQPSATRHSSSANRREQALCIDALASGEYDDMTDQEWVELCERIGRESEEGESQESVQA